MSRVFWDTNIFIYLFEDYGPLSERVITLRQSMLARGDQLFTSALTLGEILVKPMEQNDAELGHRYEQAITSVSVVVPFDTKVARRFAALRRGGAIRSPDAIQLACASSIGVDVFLTQDARLHGKQVAGIQFIVPVERAPF